MKKYVVTIAVFLFAAHGFSLPPPVPSAGVVEREIEKEYEGKPLEPDKEIPQIEIDVPKEQLSLPEGIKVEIEKVEISGNTVFSEKEIASWVDPYIHTELNIQQIHEICHVIEKKYGDEGYFLVRAYPPPQTIKDKTLALEIVEGVLGNVQIHGNQFYSQKFIYSYFKSQVGQPVNYHRFIRALVLLNETSDLTAGAVFEKGREPGTTDLIIAVQDKRPAHLYFNGNNYGEKLTTDWRTGGRIDWGSLFLYGDTFSLAEVVGFPLNALYFTDVTYQLPLNSYGTFMEFGFLYSDFKIEQLLGLHLKGISQIATWKVTHAQYRSKYTSLDLFGYFDYKQIKNIALGEVISYDKLRVVTLGSLFDHYNPSLGRDYLNFQLAFGIPDFLGGLDAVDSQSSRPGGGGRFVQLNADYDRLQKIPFDCYLYLHGSGQWSPNKLTLPQQLYLGGEGTVRGYSLAKALGDSGYYVNVEFRTPLPGLANYKINIPGIRKKVKDFLQIVGFFDHGGAFLHGVKGLESQYLTGTGFGVRLNGPWTLTCSIDLGWPLVHPKLSTGSFTYIKVTAQAF